MSDDSRAIVPVGQRGIVASVSRQIAITDKLLAKMLTGGALSTTSATKPELVIQFASCISTAVISDDGKYILTVPEDESVIHLWDVATESLLRVFGHNIGDLIAIKFQLDNMSAVTEHSDNFTRYWDLSNGACYCQQTSPSCFALRSIIKKEEGEYIDSPDDIHSLWKIPMDTEVYDDKGSVYSDNGQNNSYLLSDCDFVEWHQVNIGFEDDYPIAISNGGNYALLADGQSFSLWNLEQESCIGNFKRYAQIMDYQHIACTEDGIHLMATGSGSYLHHWNLQKGQLDISIPCAGRVTAMAFSKENHLALSLDYFQLSLFSWQEIYQHAVWPDFQGDILYQLCDIQTGKCLRKFDSSDHFYEYFVLLNLSAKIAIGTDGKFKHFFLHPADQIYRVFTGKDHKALQGHLESITTIMFSPTGNQLVSASEDRTIRLWDSETGDCLHIFTGHDGSVIHVSFTNHGQQIISASHDGTIRFWNVKTGAELAQCYGFDDGNWIVVAPDGRYDSSNDGNCPHLRWTVGMESFPVAKFKEQYFTPGLLVKVRG